VRKITLELVEGAQDFTLHHPQTDDRPLELHLVLPLLEADDRLLKRCRQAEKPFDASFEWHTASVASGCRCPLDADGSVARQRTPPLVHLAHLDELEAERLDLLEHAVEGGLVCDLAAEDRLDRLDLRIEAFEAREQPFGQPPAHAELVPAGFHRVNV
jgi:hypothetical protein